MRNDRWGFRALKLAILCGSIGLIVEGLFELKLLVQPIASPASVPGQSKIYEHFVIQHLTFPLIGFFLVFFPRRINGLVSSRFAIIVLAVIATLVTIPEIIVSQKDLFRPYPFNLRVSILETIQMISVFGKPLNLLQLQHLIFSHFFLMGTIIVLAIRGNSFLLKFAGPRTGEIMVTSNN
ncbi:MAG: hypothetical protein O9264_02750 [Leptospira sp.]|nr:hypothetical protein [Leptospira sp.]